MTRRFMIEMLAFMFGGRSFSIAQGGLPVATVEFPGTCLKWLRIAEPEIRRKHLNLENYMISVIEEDDRVSVSLKSFDAPSGSRGSAGTHPGFAVEIDKADLHILKSYFLR